jgi:hypothetical protein
MAPQEQDAEKRFIRAEGEMAPCPPEELLVQAYFRKAGRRDEEKKNQILNSLRNNSLPASSLYLSIPSFRKEGLDLIPRKR